MKVRQFGVIADPSVYDWDELTGTFVSSENELEINYFDDSEAVFHVGNGCLLNLGDSCEVHAGDCTVINSGDWSKIYVGNKSCVSVGYSSYVEAKDHCEIMIAQDKDGLSVGAFKVGSNCHLVTGAFCNFEAKDGCTFSTKGFCCFIVGSDNVFSTGKNCEFISDDTDNLFLENGEDISSYSKV